MNRFHSPTDRARSRTEIAEGSWQFCATVGEDCDAREDHARSYRSVLQDKSFSLTIKAADGCTLLETRFEHIHQAFQRLIDWSIDYVGQDVCAAISGPSVFYTDERMKSSPDFGWIESA